MRIGVVTTSYPRAPGDPAGAFVAGHVRWLRDRGHDVEVVAAGDRADESLDEAGARVLRVPAPAGLFYAGGAPERIAAAPAALAGAGAFSLRLAAALGRRARSWDAVCAHWLVPSAAAAAARAGGRPLLAIAHSGDVHLARRLRLVPVLGAALAARGARLAFVSERLRRGFLAAAGFPALRRTLERASTVCPMGIDVADRAAPARARGTRTVVFLARLVPIKGGATLIDAAARMRDPIDLVIAGEGPERPWLEDLARRRGVQVRFTGEVRGRARDALLAAADVAALPSVPVDGDRVEGTPVTAFEAMAAGCAVVASRTGGLAELPSGAVSLVPPGDPDALAAAIERLLGDDDRRVAQVERARALVASRDWSEVGPRLWKHWMCR